jgi:signal transduction histidine kinase
LRNPLNVASGYVDILQDEYDENQFDPIVTAHDRMERIIEETLLLARSGQMISEPDPVSLADLVDRCWTNVETKAATQEVTSTATVVADADRIEHVFENLFRSAVEHGGAAVTVRVGTLPNGFYVEDDGPAIPDDEHEAVFSSEYSTTGGGTGFGLAIVRQIVDAHGWDTCNRRVRWRGAV